MQSHVAAHIAETTEDHRQASDIRPYTLSVRLCSQCRLSDGSITHLGILISDQEGLGTNILYAASFH
ncbi:hypothetical protein D3C73_1546520 [compost metagenome]